MLVWSFDRNLVTYYWNIHIMLREISNNVWRSPIPYSIIASYNFHFPSHPLRKILGYPKHLHKFQLEPRTYTLLHFSLDFLSNDKWSEKQNWDRLPTQWRREPCLAPGVDYVPGTLFEIFILPLVSYENENTLSFISYFPVLPNWPKSPLIDPKL